MADERSILTEACVGAETVTTIQRCQRRVSLKRKDGTTPISGADHNYVTAARIRTNDTGDHNYADGPMVPVVVSGERPGRGSRRRRVAKKNRKIVSTVPDKRPKIAAVPPAAVPVTDHNEDCVYDDCSPNRNSRGGDDEGGTALETNAAQVALRFRRGCECADESCFRGLSADAVFRHRLNIAELTKAEHDMYLMGVTMSCLADPQTTQRQKQRRRMRTLYVYRGRRVCLDAFLYLENCTYYQVKRIRKHVMAHGVTPRVHGNLGRRPHNTLALDTYQQATEFIRYYLEEKCNCDFHSHALSHTVTNDGTSKASRGVGAKPQRIGVAQMQNGLSRMALYKAYLVKTRTADPDAKPMGYSTFRQFMKDQFPHVKFAPPPSGGGGGGALIPGDADDDEQDDGDDRLGGGVAVVDADLTTMSKMTVQGVLQQQHLEPQQVIPFVVSTDHAGGDTLTASVIDGATAHQLIAQSQQQPQHQHTYILAPFNSAQLVSTTATGGTLSYQISNSTTTGYVIGEQGNFIATSAQNPYSQYAKF